MGLWCFINTNRCYSDTLLLSKSRPIAQEWMIHGDPTSSSNLSCAQRMKGSVASPGKLASTSNDGVSNGNRFTMLGFIVLTIVMITYSIGILPIISIEVMKALGITADVIDLGTTLLLAAAGGFVILVGQASDKFSHKTIYMFSSILMIVGGLLASFPINGEMLLAGRLVIGIACVGMSIPCVAFLNLRFPVNDSYRDLAFGLFTAGFGLGLALAPIVGGFLGSWGNLGWHWVSLIVPLTAIVCMVGVSTTVKGVPAQNPDTKLDIGGSLLLGAVTVLLVIGLNEAPSYGWIAPTKALQVGEWNWSLGASMPLVLIVLAVILAIIFAFYERRLNKVNRPAALDFSLFENSAFAAGLIACFLFFLGSFAAILVIPRFFLMGLGLSMVDAGVSLLPIGLSIMVGGYVAGPIGNKLSSRTTVILGFCLIAGGSLALIPFIHADSNGWLTAVPLIILGAGFGIVYARIAETVLAVVPPTKVGLGAATMFSSRMLAGAFGAVMLSVVLTTASGDRTKDALKADSTKLSTAQMTELYTLVDRGSAFTQEAGGFDNNAGTRSYQEVLEDEEMKPAVAIIEKAFSFGFRIVMGIVALIALLGAGATLKLPKNAD